jgi:DNA invertase Pin-like site-specific DNA recombinase/peptidoglycan hydrolase-like protein with peptidoglycan-binding domain
MSSHLFAVGDRARSITSLAALLAAAVLTAAPTSAAATSGRGPTLLGEGAGMGSTPSARVRAVQRQLHHLGYALGPAGVDGRFGPWTAAAVRRLQTDQGLAVDGVVGDETRRTLRVPTQTAQRTKAQSDPLRSVQVIPVHDVASRRRAAPHAHTRTPSMGLLGLGGGRPGSALAAGLLGGLSGAIAALALGIGASRRQRPESTADFRGPPVAANLTTPPHDGAPDAWTVYVPNDDDTAGPIRAPAADGALSPSELPGGHTAIGYVTVSADPDSREALRSSAAIEATCKRADWNLVEIVADRENGRILERPGLGYALERIAAGHARVLIVSDLQRLSRSIVDLGALMAWFRDANATLIALDLGIDTSTAEGDRVATTLIALSARAHERIADRTRIRLAERRANGASNGRPAVRDRPELMKRIAVLRARGQTLQAIADQLNAEGIPTLRGGAKWRPSSIQAALGYRRPGPRDHLPRLTRDRP